MTATQDKPMQTPNAPLNVKEQLEASVNRFWTSVTSNNKGNDGGLVTNGAIKVPGIPVGLFAKRSSSRDEHEAQNHTTSCNHPNGIQFMLNTMFSSCTTGGHDLDTDSNNGSEDAPSLLQEVQRSRTELTTALTTSSSRGETSAPVPVTPSPLHQQKSKQVSAVKAAIQESSKNLFKNNHEIAQEAIHRLRQQHQLDQSEQLVTNSLYDSEVAVDAERCSLLSTRSSMFSNNNSTLSFNPSTLSNNRTLSTFQDSAQEKTSQSRKTALQKLISNRANKRDAKIPANANMKPSTNNHNKNQEHSFFPASKPKDVPRTTRKERRIREKLKRNKGVPKEVTPTSPIRMLRSRNNQRQKQLLNSTISSEDKLFNNDFNAQCEAYGNQEAEKSWDMNDDGISDISQLTVDRMVRAISQHLRVFPEEAELLNRIHSDLTDPAPVKGNSEDLFPMLGGDVAGFSRMVTPPRGGVSQATKGMSPALLTRNFGSVGTRSFFTKTTHSTQTNDFANAWKVDEQNFWDSEVANENKFNPWKGTNESSPGTFKLKKRNQKRCESSTITTATTPTTLFSSPHSPPSFFCRQHEESQEISFTDHDKLMDNLVKQTELQMAEI